MSARFARIVAQALVLMALGTQGLRMSGKPLSTAAHGSSGAHRDRDYSKLTKKFISGVPVLNYHLVDSTFKAKGVGKHGEHHQSLSEMGRRKQGGWIASFKSSVSEEDQEKDCHLVRCNMAGKKAGVMVIDEEGDLTRLNSKNVEFLEPNVEVSIPNSENEVNEVPDKRSVATPDGSGAGPYSPNGSDSSDGSNGATKSSLLMHGAKKRESWGMPWGLHRIGGETRAKDGKGIHIYILDTGIRYTHEEFGGRAVPALDLTKNVVSDCVATDLTCALDDQGHGSHCAGIAAGNTFGVAPQATLHAIKVLKSTGSGDISWSMEALDWLSTKRQAPAVASMSLGVKSVLNSFAVAVDTAVNAGIVVVVASGNSNMDACAFSPAFTTSAITVGSTNPGDDRSSFSNYGRCVDIYAPGSSILSVDYLSNTGAVRHSGTSMACPAVAGAAGLILQADPLSTPSDVMAQLQGNSDKNVVGALTALDTDELVFVGMGTPPPAQKCHTSADALAPDADGDCTCKSGMACRLPNGGMCPTSAAAGEVYKDIYFIVSCTTCKCYSPGNMPSLAHRGAFSSWLPLLLLLLSAVKP